MRSSLLGKASAAHAALVLAMAPVAAYAQSQPAPPSAPSPAPPLPPIGLGTTTFLDAEGGPGTLFQWNSSAYLANRLNDGHANRVPVDFKTDSQAVLLHVAHTTKQKLLGAYVGAEVLLPVAHVRVRPGAVGESTTGFGDAIFGAYLQWSQKKLLGRPFAARLDFDVIAPTGDYSRDKVVNLGNNAWSISPYLALTWQVADRWEISNRTNFNWTGKNTAPPHDAKLRSWQAGSQLAVNLSASYELTKTWRAGISGYTLQQLSDSRVDGERIDGKRQKVWAIGPGVRWSRGNKMVIVNAYKEFAAENRPQGYQGVLRVLTVF